MVGQHHSSCRHAAHVNTAASVRPITLTTTWIQDPNGFEVQRHAQGRVGELATRRDQRNGPLVATLRHSPARFRATMAATVRRAVPVGTIVHGGMGKTILRLDAALW